MIPKIGLIVNIDKDLKLSMYGDYGQAIEMSGGLPLVLPYIEYEELINAFIEICDGFFTGGADIAPKYYGEIQKDTCGAIEPARDQLEIAAARKALFSNKPIFAICRGLQILNVVMGGGTLYQDIPTEFEMDILHRQAEDKYQPFMNNIPWDSDGTGR